MYYSYDSRSTITFCASTNLLSTPHEINIDSLIYGSDNRIRRKAMPLHKLPKYWYWRYSKLCQPNTLFGTYLSSINATSQISLEKYGVRSEASTAATTAKISTVALWVVVKHVESPWENRNSKQPFWTIVLEAGLRMIILLQTPMVNSYGHSLPIYLTSKT
jgi:hypothetical protein